MRGGKALTDKARPLTGKEYEEALNAFFPHFAALTHSEATMDGRTHLLTVNEHHREALRALKYDLDFSKKFRIVLDYDPEFPWMKFEVFGLS